MNARVLFFTTCLILTYSGTFGNLLAPKHSEQLLRCMAKCVDYRMLRELDNCQKNFPIDIIPGSKIGERNHLVTMTRKELYTIVYCVAFSKDRVIQRKFDTCISHQPQQVRNQIDNCSAKFGAGTGFGFYDAIVDRPPLLPQIHVCIDKTTVDYVPKEVQEEIAFENCAREVYKMACGSKTSLANLWRK